MVVQEASLVDTAVDTLLGNILEGDSGEQVGTVSAALAALGGGAHDDVARGDVAAAGGSAGAAAGREGHQVGRGRDEDCAAVGGEAEGSAWREHLRTPAVKHVVRRLKALGRRCVRGQLMVAVTRWWVGTRDATW